MKRFLKILDEERLPLAIINCLVAWSLAFVIALISNITVKWVLIGVMCCCLVISATIAIKSFVEWRRNFK